MVMSDWSNERPAAGDEPPAWPSQPPPGARPQQPPQQPPQPPAYPGYGPPNQDGYGYRYGGPVPTQTDSGARNAVIVGVIGLLVCGIILGLTAIVLGTQARRRIRESNGRLGGDGLALAGVILGCVDIVTAALTVVFILPSLST
jgi:hypothetical protein